MTEPKRKTKTRAGGRHRTRAGSARWVLDVHLTAPAAGKADSSHRIEEQEPYEIHGLMWPTSDGDPVEVDIVIEELRAQILIPEEELPRLRKDLASARSGRTGRKSESDEPDPLKPERVQARAGRTAGRRSRG